MGKATRWLKGLLGMKKSKENMGNWDSGDRKDKKRWTFAKSAKIPKSDLDLRRCYYTETDKEQNKHAIAVAAATAAAADAAVAAAHAAVEVVRLTSHGRGTLFSGGRERWAALKIQSYFRGYLSRKALRALKGLVKLQALVRGYLVRKQTNVTLHSMQALIRAQDSVRSQRARRSFIKDHHVPPQFRPRKSVERFDETRTEYNSKRLSSSYDAIVHPFDCSPKVVEIDTYKRRSRIPRNPNRLSELGDDVFSLSSFIPCQVPNCCHIQDSEWSFGDEYKYYNTSTPRIPSSGQLRAAKSLCGDSYFRPYRYHPSYMANTQSFNAKLRSHSAPKQRSETKKKLSLDELMAARNSLSGVRMRHSRSQVDQDLQL